MRNALAAKKSEQEEVDVSLRFIEVLLKMADMKDHAVPGTEQDVSLAMILGSQEKLDTQMETLINKFNEQKAMWEFELDKNDANIKEQKLRPEDFRMLRGDEKNMEVEEFKLGRNDQLIERLKESLKAPHMTSDDVCNLLVNDLYEKEKLEQQLQYKNQQIN